MDPAFDVPAPAWMVRAAGVVMGAFGIALIFLCGFIVVRQFQSRSPIGREVVVFLAVLTPVAWFCSNVGWRFTLNRPNESGSVLSPVGWLVLASIFAVLAVVMVVAAFRTREAKVAYALVGAVSFAMWSWKQRGKLLEANKA